MFYLKSLNHSDATGQNYLLSQKNNHNDQYHIILLEQIHIILLLFCIASRLIMNVFNRKYTYVKIYIQY